MLSRNVIDQVLIKLGDWGLYEPPMSRADRDVWHAAPDIHALGELSAQWLEGRIASEPGYAARTGPDPETNLLMPALADANRAGYFTYNSQPGDVFERWDGSEPVSQRAWIVGFAASEATTDRLAAAAEQHGLVVVTGRAGRRIRYSGPDQMGVVLSRGHITDGYIGWGICAWDVQDQLCSAWQVALIDPVSGRNDRALAALQDFVA